MLNKIRKLQNKKGFTLVELIVVIAIIAILTAVIVPLVSRYTTQATYTSLQSAASSVESQVNAGINSYAMTGKVFSGKFITGKCGASGTPTTITVDDKSITITESGGTCTATLPAGTTDDGLKKLAENIATGLATKFPNGAAFAVIVQNGGVVGTIYCPNPPAGNGAAVVPTGKIETVSGYDDAYTVGGTSCGILGTIKAGAGETASKAKSFTIASNVGSVA